MRMPRAAAVAQVLIAALAMACTESRAGGNGPGPGDGSASASGPTASSPAPSKPGVYTLDQGGVGATFRYAPGGGTLTVTNRSGAQIAAPGIYLLDASDGRRVPCSVTGYAPIPDGATYTFKVAFARAVAPDDVGLVVLLIGAANYGSFVPPST